MYNPSLREEPRHLPAQIIPLKQESSILDWLESTGRLLARDVHEPDSYLDDDDVEISELMSGDEVAYDLEDEELEDEDLDLEE
ncbi:MAG: DUF3134 domain-containing protein [Oscillatoriaceae bacterium SKW80]|nr:DUF3134 domain-containing protein [Oscillatoriaceae bacterium SKYG93]MCX8120824.1 DUF3134 domain-containing protein [Oscillatoriaceae bacterium SKW80]MDW8453690.1 DUF3134 domain-containing protein [Oscillatoriaceae cyanobacterium SKYGB_i_bin93]HIK27717.1 DUF3134 domain-containing protein [Oscillatoriaceae cyanobacterium M7585_C2015_266]